MGNSFIRKVKKGLDGYLSRFEQLANLPNIYKDHDIKDFKYNFNLTEITLVMSIGDDIRDDKEDDIVLNLSLLYKHEQSRPDCLKVKLSGKEKNNVDSEALEELKSQCHVFYTFALDVAIGKAFM